MSSIPKPNYTQIPNVYFDEIMCSLNGSENLVFLAIMRKTFGWHKMKDKISYAQIRKMSGLSSNTTIQKALDSLIEKKLVLQEKEKAGISYEVNVETFTENVKGTDDDLYRKCKATFTENVKGKVETFTENVNTKESNINKIKKNIDFSKIEKSYAEEYEKLKGHKPTLIFAALRSRIKKLAAQGIDESLILNVIRAATKDEWIGANGFEILTILSDKMIMRLANETQSSRTSSPKKGVTCPRCGSEVIAGICTKCRALIDSEGKELT